MNGNPTWLEALQDDDVRKHIAYNITLVGTTKAVNAIYQNPDFAGCRTADAKQDRKAIRSAIQVCNPKNRDCFNSQKYGAAVAAVPVKDTIKVANQDGFVLETPLRKRLWAVQTPQVFRKSLLVEAHLIAQQRQLTATDDAALVEQLGFPVKLVHGNDENLKITTQVDLQIAAVLLENRIFE